MATAIQKRAMNHLLSISSNATVADAVERMQKTGEDALIVYELGRVFGVFTEHDAFQKILEHGLDARNTSIRSVMTKTPTTAPDSIQIEEAISALHEEKRSHLILVDKNENVVGIVSLKDLLEIEVEKLHLDNKDLSSYLMADGLGG